MVGIIGWHGNRNRTFEEWAWEEWQLWCPRVNITTFVSSECLASSTKTIEWEPWDVPRSPPWLSLNQLKPNGWTLSWTEKFIRKRSWIACGDKELGNGITNCVNGHSWTQRHSGNSTKLYFLFFIHTTRSGVNTCSYIWILEVQAFWTK
jgi:hypothetical protein